MSIDIRLKHSSVNGKVPQPTDLSDGELALNTNTASPAAYIKDSAGNIVQLAGAGAVGNADKLPLSGGTMTGDLVPAATGQSGYLSRAGTTLSPATAGDKLQLGGGAVDLDAGATGSPLVRDSSGRLLVGTSSARTNYNNSSTFGPILNLEGTSNSNRVLSFIHNDNSGGPFLVLGSTGGSSAGSNTLVAANSTLGFLSFQGADGSELVEAASIKAKVDGTPGADDMPGSLVFSTTADNASSPTERFSIFRDGSASFSNLTDVYPATDNAVRLGASGLRWSQVWAATGTIQTSDQRAKVDITTSTLGADFIKALRPVSYKWIEGGKVDSGKRDEDGNYIYESVPGARTHWGFIAQEVKQAVDAAGVDFGGWVLTDKDDPDSQQALRYDQFVAPLTKALQEALERIETLEAKVAALEAS